MAFRVARVGLLFAQVVASGALLAQTRLASCGAGTGRPLKRATHVVLSLESARNADTIEYIVGPLDCGCAVAWLERHPELSTPCMSIIGKNTRMTDEATLQFLDFVQETMDVGEPFAIYWDVTREAFPNMRQFRTVIAWLDEGDRAAVWDNLVICHYLVLRNPLLRGAVQIMSKIANAPQPVKCSFNAAEAVAFMRSVSPILTTQPELAVPAGANVEFDTKVEVDTTSHAETLLRTIAHGRGIDATDQTPDDYSANATLVTVDAMPVHAVHATPVHAGTAYDAQEAIETHSLQAHGHGKRDEEDAGTGTGDHHAAHAAHEDDQEGQRRRIRLGKIEISWPRRSHKA